MSRAFGDRSRVYLYMVGHSCRDLSGHGYARLQSRLLPSRHKRPHYLIVQVGVGVRRRGGRGDWNEWGDAGRGRWSGAEARCGGGRGGKAKVAGGGGGRGVAGKLQRSWCSDGADALDPTVTDTEYSRGVFFVPKRKKRSSPGSVLPATVRSQNRA